MDWRGLLFFVLFVLISLLNFSVWIQVHSKTSLRKIAERECNWSEGTRHLKTPHLTAGTHTHTLDKHRHRPKWTTHTLTYTQLVSLESWVLMQCLTELGKWFQTQMDVPLLVSLFHTMFHNWRHCANVCACAGQSQRRFLKRFCWNWAPKTSKNCDTMWHIETLQEILAPLLAQVATQWLKRMKRLRPPPFARWVSEVLRTSFEMSIMSLVVLEAEGAKANVSGGATAENIVEIWQKRWFSTKSWEALISLYILFTLVEQCNTWKKPMRTAQCVEPGQISELSLWGLTGDVGRAEALLKARPKDN